jgi:hypothetical protein
MSIDLTGITNKNEYYTNHYFSTVFEENTSATISGWNAAARESEEIRTPWSLLRQNARQYYTAHDKFVRSSVNLQVLANIKVLANSYLKSLGYPEAKPEVVTVDDSLSIPVYLEMTKSNGAPLLVEHYLRGWLCALVWHTAGEWKLPDRRKTAGLPC